MSTKILLKRTQEQLTDINQQPITFGEPIFIDNNTVWGDTSQKCKSYIALGSPVEQGKVNQAALFKGFWDVTKANSLVFFKQDRLGLVDEENNPVYADKLVVNTVDTSDNDTRYYLLCQPNIPSTSDPEHGSIKKFDMGDSGIYINSRGILHGAAWNDYAETRVITEDVKPGTVVCENGDGTLSPSTERLQPCAYVVSDTYGVVIGEDDGTPVAVSGKVLVRIQSENYKVGDCVCACIDGKAAVMHRHEIEKYPDRILGVITEIPDKYREWNGVKIGHRVWIKIK